MDYKQAKEKIKIEYDKVKTLYKNRNFITAIREKNVDDGYLATIKRIDDEMHNFSANQGVYSFISGDPKKLKLSGELNKIINKFLTDIMPIDIKYYAILEEEEEELNKQMRENMQIEKLISLFSGNVIMFRAR